MGHKTHVPLTPAVLEWAMREGGYKTRTFAKKVNVDRHTVEGWLIGETQPSQGEFTKIVDALKRPSALFFLPEAPDSTVPPELRSGPADGRPLGPAEVQKVRQALRLQRVLSEWLQQAEVPSIDFPYCELGTDAEFAGEQLRSALDVSTDEQLSWSSATEAFKIWREVVSSRRIQVFQLQLGEKGVRGFSSWNDRLPIIAINTAYNAQARTFTIFHELAHLLARTQAACTDLSPHGKRSGVEQWCEAVASAALLPAKAVVTTFKSVSEEKPFEQVKAIADAFSVSLRAAALRIGDLGLVDDPKGLYRLIDRNARSWDRTKRAGRSTEPRTRVVQRISEVGAPVVSLFGEALAAGYLHEKDIQSYMRLEPREFEEAKSRLEIAT